MKPKKLALLCVVVLALSITAGHASDPSSENNTSTSSPRVSPAEEEAAARAFSDARDNVPPWPLSIEPIPWPRIATDARTAARRLAETHREAMISVVNKRLGRGTFSFHLLTLMILEELRMPHKAVELAVSSFKRANTVDVLAVSHCSQSVREGVANALLTKCLDEPGFPRRWGGCFFVGFVAAVGNAETAELLKRLIQKITEEEAGKETRPQPQRGRNTPRDHPVGPLLNSLRQAVDRIERRLALSEDASRQRFKDELLFWQTQEHAPNFRSGDGAHLSAWAVAASKLRVSPDYLTEILGRARNEEPPALEDWDTALELVVAQKENAAVPTLVEFVKRDPRYRQKIEKVLREMGTPAAEKGLQEIDVYCW